MPRLSEWGDPGNLMAQLPGEGSISRSVMGAACATGKVADALSGVLPTPRALGD